MHLTLPTKDTDQFTIRVVGSVIAMAQNFWDPKNQKDKQGKESLYLQSMSRNHQQEMARLQLQLSLIMT